LLHEFWADSLPTSLLYISILLLHVWYNIIPWILYHTSFYYIRLWVSFGAEIDRKEDGGVTFVQKTFLYRGGVPGGSSTCDVNTESRGLLVRG